MSPVWRRVMPRDRKNCRRHHQLPDITGSPPYGNARPTAPQARAGLLRAPSPARGSTPLYEAHAGADAPFLRQAVPAFASLASRSAPSLLAFVQQALQSYIVRNGTPQISSLRRTLATLDAVLLGGADRPITEIARELAIPPATAHRQVVTLAAEGYLARSEGGGYVAGPRLLRLLRHLEENRAVDAILSGAIQPHR